MKNKAQILNFFKKSFLVFLLLLCSCKEALLHNLSEIQANRLIGILNSEGIEASKELQADSKWTLMVNKQDLVDAISLLDSKRLLKDNTSTIKESSSLLGSNQEKNFYYERVLSSELEKTLLTLSGVFDARVHLNIKKSDALSLKNEDDVKTSASVLMVVNETEDFDENKIKSIISGASGIEPKDVSIVISKINLINRREKEEPQDFADSFTSKTNPKENFVNTGVLSVSQKENIFKKIVNFLISNAIYVYVVIGIVIACFALKLLKKYKNNKKLDLITTVSIISK